MKVIKRDGRVVDFDKSKIKIAVEKANKEVTQKEKASSEDIKIIIQYIEELNKKRILVEDVQDIIEKKLMEFGKYELAKKYIVYRYTRALIRKSNTTDASLLGLIRNGNKNLYNNKNEVNAIMASTQRDLIVGEVSKDLTRRILLPEKIIKAWDNGEIYFHDSEYFIQPIFNSCIVNISDMLDNGTIINGMMIESPKSFQIACTILTQIIGSIANNQYGEQLIDIASLGKYLRKSKEKIIKDIEEELQDKIDKSIKEQIIEKRLKAEIYAGVQIIQCQINTLMTTSGHIPNVTLILRLDEDDEFIEENAIIVEEIFNQRILGIKNEMGENIIPKFPKLLYILDKLNCLEKNKYDYITKLAIECTKKGGYLSYISAKNMKEKFYMSVGKFNQGIVTINLPQIAIIADGDEKKFWKILDQRLNLCKEALMCRHYALISTTSDISPIHWKNGAIARLKSGEKIDRFLCDDYSNLSLGYIGLYEMTKLMKKVTLDTKEGMKFAKNVLEYLNNTISRWKKENNIEFVLYGIYLPKLNQFFAKKDRENFGTIEGITDKDEYTNSYQINDEVEIDLYNKIKLEKDLQKIASSNTPLVVKQSDIEDMENFVKFIYNELKYVVFE